MGRKPQKGAVRGGRSAKKKGATGVIRKNVLVTEATAMGGSWGQTAREEGLGKELTNRGEMGSHLKS